MPGFKSKGTEPMKKEKPAKKQSEKKGSFFSKKEKKPQKPVGTPQPVAAQMPNMAEGLAPLPHFKNSLQVAGLTKSEELREIFEHFIGGGELHPLVEDRAVGTFDPQASFGKVQVTIL